jgi:membrane AbrB-like protein
MPLPTIDPHRVRDAGETLLIAAIGAAVFVWIHFPADLICGSMLSVAAAALAGRPMVVPAPLARLTFFIIGMSLGATVRPETLHGIFDWPLSIALISVSALCMTLGTMAYLRFVHGWDARSALYGGSPGAMAQVISLAVQSGADLRGVVIVQTVRVVFVSVSIPVGLALFGLAAPATATLGSATFNASATELLILVVFSVATAMLLHWIRFPASIVFGAMLGSGILHGSGFLHAALPWWFVSAFVVMMGATVGQRFANTPARLLLAYLGAAVGSFAVAASVCASFAVLVAALTPARIADLVIAFAPGAQDTMMVLALALNGDPVFVGAHQLARFLTISLSLPVFTYLFTRNGKAAEEDGKKLEKEKAKPPEAEAKKPEDVFPKK